FMIDKVSPARAAVSPSYLQPYAHVKRIIVGTVKGERRVYRNPSQHPEWLSGCCEDGGKAWSQGLSILRQKPAFPHRKSLFGQGRGSLPSVRPRARYPQY